MAFNYKDALAVIGRRLAEEHGFSSEPMHDSYLAEARSRSIDTLVHVTEFFDTHSVARKMLFEMGGEWPMPDPVPDSSEHQDEEKCPTWFEDECCCDEVLDRAHLYYDRWLGTLQMLRQVDPKTADEMVRNWDDRKRRMEQYGTLHLCEHCTDDRSPHTPETCPYRESAPSEGETGTADRDGWRKLAKDAIEASGNLHDVAPTYPRPTTAAKLGKIVLKLLEEQPAE